MDAMLSIDCFGDLRLRGDNRALASPATPKSRELLAYLVAQRKRPSARKALARALFPDDLESDARTKLRKHLHRLHQALPPGNWIDEDAAGITLHAAAITTDVWSFDAAIADERIDEALRLYAGDFMVDFEAAWVVRERERLRQELMRALHEATTRARADAAYDKARAYAQAALAIDPWREDMIRALASAAYELGDKAEALRQLDAFAERLRTDLRTNPMPETLALADAMHRDARITTRRPLAAALARPTVAEMPFVGRTAILEQVDREFLDVVGGASTITCLSGEAGIGKSRLARELVARLESRGARSFWGTTSPVETQPYQAFIEIVRAAIPMLASLKVDPVSLCALSRLVPQITQALPGVVAPVPLDLERDRARLFESIARFMEALSDARPAVLVFEDLHHAGNATIDLIESLAHRLKRERVLLVLTFREGSHLRRLHRVTPDERNAFHLGRLDLCDVDALCRAMLPDAADAETIHARSDGNPFFVGEIIRDRLATGTATQSVPLAASELVSQHFLALDETAQHIGEVAATIGPAFDLEMLQAASGWPASDIDRALDQLIQAHLVRESPFSRRTDFVFSHQIVQEAIYARCEAAVLRRRHARVARAFPTLYAGRGEELMAEVARHYQLAGLESEAASAFLRAARFAASIFANEEAVVLASRGLACASAHDVRYELHLEREAAYARLGDRIAQSADLDDLERLAGLLQDDAREFEALRLRVALLHEQDARDAEVAALLRLETVAKGPEARCDAALARAKYSQLIGETTETEHAVLLALKLARSIESRDRIVEALCVQASIELVHGDFNRTSECLNEARRLAQTDAALHLRTLRTSFRLEASRSDFGRVIEVSKEALTLAQTVGDRLGVAEAYLMLSLGYAGENDLPAAVQHSDAALAIYATQDNERDMAKVEINRVTLDYRRGALADALAHSRRARELFERVNEQRGMLVSRLNEALTQLYLGDYAAATEAASHGLTMARLAQDPRFEAHALTVIGSAQRALGHSREAIAALSDAIAIWDSLNESIGQPECLAQRALAHLSASNFAEAEADECRIAAYGADEVLRMELPQLLLWCRAQVKHALHDDVEATRLRDEANAVLEARVAAIEGAEFAAQYLALPLNREIYAAVASSVWPHRESKSEPRVSA